MALSYNTTMANAGYIYRYKAGGTFSANLAGSTTFDYFDDTFGVGDMLYIGRASSGTYFAWSDVTFNIGTAIVGTGITGVWEYFKGATLLWKPLERYVDETVGFTATGAKRLKFGYQDSWCSQTVNGTITSWIRYRITGVTTRTEGGANSTSIPQVGDGAVNVNGYTTPACTLTDIYNYMNTNYPYVGAVKNSNYFDFRWFSIKTNSPTTSSNEILELGFDTLGLSNVRGLTTFDYWTTGTLVGTNHGKAGSKIILNAITNSYPCTFTVNQKSYGAQYISNPNKNAGYPILGGTFYDCLLQLAPGSVGIGDIQNCTFEIGFGFIVTFWATALQNPFLNNKFIITGTSGWSMYTVSMNVNKPDITFDTGLKYLVSSQQNNLGGIVWNFIDPVGAIPTFATTNKPILNTRPTTPGNISNVFFFDASAGTYTDYTTQASDATVSDVPINGDIGDCLYLNILPFSTTLAHPWIASTIGGTNDYVYEWEYYKTSAWKSFTRKWDETNNLVQNGAVWFERAVSDITQTTINGVAGYWYRLRIVTKGTGTPMIDRIRWVTRPGTSNWQINYQNSINYTAKDSSGNALAGVEVTVCDNTGTCQFTGTTGALGTIASGNVTTNKYYFDPLDATRDTIHDTVEKLYNPFVYTSRKYGYMPQVTTATISLAQTPVNVFLENPNVVVSQATAHAYTGIDVNGTTNTITISEDHTMQEVYDYCEDWYSLTANMAYNEPFITTDGQNFTSTYDLVLDNCALTGTGRISIVVNTVTYIGTATSTLDIVAVDGTHTNIKLTGLESGSRVQLYDTNVTTELYNEIVNATTLTYPIIWTSDKPIRIRIMYVNGTTAKEWFETTATLTNTGINLAVNQTDDTVYNKNLVDGSIVTECSIVGTTLVVNVDDPDNKTTAQRIYAYEVYWLSTENGIKDQSLYIDATDQTHYILEGGLKIKNLDMVNPLNITGANLEPLTGSATDILDTSGGMILINPETVVPFAYNVNGATEAQFDELISKTSILDRKVDDTQTRVITLTE